MPNKEIILHGTFVSLFGVGAHIMGEPGIGKSELALALIGKKHQLIADDAPLFARKGECILGRNPLEAHFISVRGVGLFDILSVFGAASVRAQHQLDIIINLQAVDSPSLSHLEGNCTTKDILGCLIPCLTIPIIKPRNLEVIVETVVKNFLVAKNNKHHSAVAHFQDLLSKKMELKSS